MASEIPYDEFLHDIRRQQGREVEKPLKKEPWDTHPEAISKAEYDSRTKYGRKRLKKPRPVWLTDQKKWTVGAPVNPIEWQILLQSDPARGRKYVSEINVETTIGKICGQFQIHRETFSNCVDRLCDRNLLKCKGGFRRSKKADKWLLPDLTGPRAGGEWHRNSIRGFVEEINQLYGCYTYVDRGYYPGVEMPDVILIRPQLVIHRKYLEPQVEPLKWDMSNPIYAEFKSARDMRKYPYRLEKQLEQYDGVPLFLKVEARIGRAKDMLKDQGRRRVKFFDLLKNPENDMVYLTGSERPYAEWSFKPVIEQIKDAFSDTYDRKARLKKTGVDPQGRECHDLILYDSLGAEKNVGQVIPNYADDVGDFAGLYFGERYLGRIATADYVYTPTRKPTYENKTWRWERTKTRGAKFRSFSA